MSKYFWGVTIAVFVALLVALPIGLKYSQATLFCGLIAAISAPVVIHKIPDKNGSLGLIMGISILASFPLKKLFQIDGFINETLVTFVYAALLWVVGFGWKRNWH